MVRMNNPAAPQQNTMQLVLEFGSMALRAIVVSRGRKIIPITDQPRYRPPGTEALRDADFSCACCPFEEDPLAYLGDKAMIRPGSVSAQALLYFLADDIGQLDRYPNASQLKAKVADRAFRAACETIVIALVRGVLARVRQGLPDLILTHLRLMIPPAAPFAGMYEEVRDPSTCTDLY